MVKNLLANAGAKGDVGLIPGFGRSPGGENGNPLQYSCLENPMDRGSWRDAVHGVATVSGRTVWVHRLRASRPCRAFTHERKQEKRLEDAWHWGESTGTLARVRGEQLRDKAQH